MSALSTHKDGFDHRQKLGLFLVSAAGLSFEITLTRLFSVAQFYHFAFLIVSIALLGFGASGTALSVFESFKRKSLQELLPWIAFSAALSILLAYLLINWLPFDSFSMAWDRRQIIILLVHFIVLAAPFFFNGLMTGLLLTRKTASHGQVYAVNLLGSAAGCLLAVLAPSYLQGEGTVTLSIALASLAAIVLYAQSPERHSVSSTKLLGRLVSWLMLILALGGMILFLLCGSGLDILKLRLSPYKSISYALQQPGAEITFDHWNSFSLVNVVNSPSIHSIPGLSYRYLESLPSQAGLFVDGDNLNALLPSDAEMNFANFLPEAVAFQLKPQANTLILEPRGGLSIQVALALGAKQVTVVEANPLVIQAADAIYHQPRVEVAQASDRSYLSSTTHKFDLILLPLTDSYHPVSSGAYSLGEDYRYTVESFEYMLSALKPDGLLVLSRWLQNPPSECLRTFATAITALEEMGFNPQDQLIVMRGYNTGTFLVKNNTFTAAELTRIRTFAAERAFDMVYAPGLDSRDANRYNLLPEDYYYSAFHDLFINQPRDVFYSIYAYDVRPPTDDHPFFGHYFKWSQARQIWQSLGKTWQPFGGAGYFVILALLAAGLLLAAALILLPLISLKKQQGRKGSRQTRPFIYFGLIGLAYLLVEMPLIQRYILFLGNPAYALTSVLFTLLLFSGLGSQWGSRRLSASSALILLCLLLVVIHLFLPWLMETFLGSPLPARWGIGILIIAPLGFLMGIPFPSGLTWLEYIYKKNTHSSIQGMIAWVWAINGAASVIASILASLLALSLGFNWTFLIGTACYLGALLMVWGFAPHSQSLHP